MEDDEKESIKILFLGEDGVGKSSIIEAYSNLKFDPNHMSTSSFNCINSSYSQKINPSI